MPWQHLGYGISPPLSLGLPPSGSGRLYSITPRWPWHRMSFCILTRLIFVFAPCSTRPKLHLTESSGLVIITRITLEIELFTTLNCFAGAVKTQKLMGAPFLFELVAVS